MFDFLLPRETKNLIKINKIAQEYNDYLYKDNLRNMIKRLYTINTQDHQDKKDIYLFMINQSLWQKSQSQQN